MTRPLTDAPLDPRPLPDPTSVFRLEGRTAIVTGASSGLGWRFARVLHAAGAGVVVAARRLERLDALAAHHPRMTAVACDITRPDDVQRLVDATLEQSGRVDVLVNNAGICVVHPAEDEPLDVFSRVLDVNLRGQFHLTQLVARHMLVQGGGSIVYAASVLGTVAAAPISTASYCASKGAVVNLTRELACQWARKGVRVNALAPGWFLSEMTAALLDDSKAHDYLVRNCPMGRVGRDEELDGMLLFLSSDASSYVTGQVFAVDGGWTAR